MGARQGGRRGRGHVHQCVLGPDRRLADRLLTGLVAVHHAQRAGPQVLADQHRRPGDAGGGQGPAGADQGVHRHLGLPQGVRRHRGRSVRRGRPARPERAEGQQLSRARKGIVKVQGVASSCSKHIEGTGFVYSQDRIMTNAHVVAGVDKELQVTDYLNHTHRAKVVLYNPDRDIAILYVPGLNMPLLRFDGNAKQGDDAIIAGFPHGLGFTTNEARIRVQQRANGPDIYERKSVTRDVYSIRGLVRQGNSGGPLLTTDGRVYGVVFAAVLDQPETGFVLTAAEVAPDAEDGSKLVNAVSTQECNQN
ncbi:MarP family serine protease [Streptosporangium lutulentum]